MRDVIVFVLKAAATGFLLLFVLGFGALGLCGTMGLASHEFLTGLLFVVVAGAAIWGLIRLIMGLWSSGDDDRDGPADDDA
ncbi:hypothetical protein [Roseateles sp. BYS96W]|uniref:Uncharacterized protein n=1 Tax=Pelomonas nitida TaxID=3299027 RepID=A0ABW7GAN1_9BURK